MHSRYLDAAAFAAASLAASASAVELPAGFGLAGEAALVSDYRFRGISLSDGAPALQAGLTLSHDSGLYAGAWGSSIEGDPLYGSVEIDLYAGWSGEIAPGTELDAMLAYYTYPGGDDRLGAADYVESSAKVSHSFGPVVTEAGASYSWAQAGLGGSDNFYLFTDASAGLPGTPVTVKAHAGYTDGALAPDGRYLDWSLGAETVLGPVTVGAAYVDTDLDPAHDVDAAIVFSVAAAF